MLFHTHKQAFILPARQAMVHIYVVTLCVCLVCQVCRVPNSTAAAAVVPSVKQLVHASMLEQHRHPHSPHPAAATAAPAAASREDTQPAAAGPQGGAAGPQHSALQQDTAGVAGAGLVAAPAEQQSSTQTKPKAGAVISGQQDGLTSTKPHPRLQGTALDEPALPFAWVQLHDRQAGAPAAADSSSHCSVSSFAVLKTTVAAEQAGYNASILAACADSPAGSGHASTDAGFVCLELPDKQCRQAAPDAGRLLMQVTTHQQQMLQHLVVPADAVPTVLPMPPAPSSVGASKQQPGEQAAAAASKPRPEQPSTASILRGWIASISRLKPKQVAAGGTEALVRKRRSVAVPSAARSTPKVSEQPLAVLAAGVGTDAAAGVADGVASGKAKRAPGSTEPGHAPAPIHADTQQLQLQQEHSQAAEPEEGSRETQDDSCGTQCSPGSLLVEVPVCNQQLSEPLDVHYRRSALLAALAVLDANTRQELPEASQQGAEWRAAAGSAVADTTGSGPVWDASWGNLGPQGGAGAYCGAEGPGVGASTAWCTPAVLHMLSGAALQPTAAVDEQQQQQNDDPALLAASLLEQMVAADMQLGDDDSGLLLPVVLFPDIADWQHAGAPGGSSSTTGLSATCASMCTDLQVQCGYKRQPTAHLELYFDWSLLQPQHQQHQLSSSNRLKRDSSGLFGTAGVKRLKMAAGCALAQGQGTQQQDPHAWLSAALDHPGLKQLQQDLSRVQQTAAGSGATTAAAAAQLGDSTVQVAQSLSRQVFAAYLLHPQHKPCAASKPVRPDQVAASTQGPATDQQGAQTHAAAEEGVPPEVAAASAAWRLAWDQEAKRAVPIQPGAAAAAVGSAVAAAPAPMSTVAAMATIAAPSDLDFFMQLQGAQQAQRAKRRHSSVAAQQLRPTTAVAVDAAAEAARTAAPAAQAVSLSPAGAVAKRPRVSGRQQEREQQRQSLAGDESAGRVGGEDLALHEDDTKRQQQRHTALATADLALNGVMRAAAAQQVAAAHAAEAAAAAGPTVLTVSVSEPILKLLLQLHGMRRSVLSAMQYPGPELVESLPWQDAAAQQQLLQLKAQQQERGQGPSAQQRQHSKQLVVLVLLSQTAACLLHYGIRVAHMFLQHGLQRLPSVVDACRPVVAALAAASDALERRPAAAGSSTRTLPAPGEHPKLARLRELVLQLKSAQPVSVGSCPCFAWQPPQLVAPGPHVGSRMQLLGCKLRRRAVGLLYVCVQDCKLLLVAETKAFFDLYHNLSAAGILAVQLDRDRNLPMTAQAQAAGAAQAASPEAMLSSAADPAMQAAWAAAVKSAQAAAGCVLATHEQLQHPCMALQGFNVLIEYVALRDAATASAAGGAVAGGSAAAVSAHFDRPGRHFVFAVKEPNLAQAAAEGERADANATAADPHGPGPDGPAADADQAAAECRMSPAVKAQQQQQPATRPGADTHAVAAASVAHPAQAEAEAGPAAAAGAAPGQEIPLVLNVSPGSLVKHRPSLYQSLMQLETQGYTLIERALGGGSSRRGQAAAAASGAAVLAGRAIDIVLTPKACLCIFDDSKLPQVCCKTLDQACSR